MSGELAHRHEHQYESFSDFNGLILPQLIFHPKQAYTGNGHREVSPTRGGRVDGQAQGNGDTRRLAGGISAERHQNHCNAGHGEVSEAVHSDDASR